MRGVIQTAERVRDGVHIADTGAGEREACLEGGDHHVLTGLEILAVRIGDLEVIEDELDGLFGKAQALLGVVRPADVRLDRVGKRVHAGGRSRARRQADGQLRIENGIQRHELEIHERVLVVRLAVGDDGGDRRLTAGSGRRRDGDDRRHGLADTHDTGHVVAALFRAGNAGSRTLGRIHRAAAAESDKAAAAGLHVLRTDLLDRGHGGVGLDLAEHLVGHTGLLERREELRSERLDHVRTGDDHDLFHTALAEHVRYLFKTAGTGEHDRLAPMQAAHTDVKHLLVGAVISFFQSIHNVFPSLRRTGGSINFPSLLYY